VTVLTMRKLGRKWIQNSRVMVADLFRTCYLFDICSLGINIGVSAGIRRKNPSFEQRFEFNNQLHVASGNPSSPVVYWGGGKCSKVSGHLVFLQLVQTRRMLTYRILNLVIATHS